MKKREMARGIFLGVWLLLGLRDMPARSATPADDPYNALQQLHGKWNILPAADGQGGMQLDNHCAKTGLFFVCEQVVNGKTAAMVVFLPVSKTATGGEEYRTQALLTDASPAGYWTKLTIESDKWVYLWESTEAGRKVHWRNTNRFSGTDKIHFEIQSSEDGATWKTQQSGDEQRVK
jgi:hypothetical protein